MSINWKSIASHVNSVENTIHWKWKKRKRGIVFIYGVPANYLSSDTLLEYINLLVDGEGCDTHDD